MNTSVRIDCPRRGLFVAAGPSHARNDIQRSDAGFAAAMTPVILKRQLSNGLRVWIVEQHDLPVVQMSLLVLTGTDADPRGRYGIASLTSAMLTAGRRLAFGRRDR